MSGGAAMTTSASAPRMSLWRLEWLRLFRTPRALALGAVFVAMGLIEPAFTKYASTLLRHVGHGARISVPPPTAADGLNSYVSEATLVGLVLLVILAAGALGFDAKPGLATFLRTRVASIWQLITPRFTAYAVAGASAYLLGTLAAWFETWQLIGPLPVAGLLGGVLCGSVYLVFAVAVTAFAAGLGRGTLAAAGIAFMILLAVPILGTISAISNWLPSALISAPADLADGTHQLPHFLPPLCVTVAASVVALVLAAWRLRSREI